MVHCNNINGRSLLPHISSLLVLFMIGSVSAHTYLSSLIINGNALQQGDGMRPHPNQNKEYPLADVSMRPNGLNSDDMICGFLPDAARPANRKITVAAGSQIGLQWWHTSPGDDVLARTHKGPCMVWMAKSETGAGNVWFKIWQKGYDSSRGRWCTDDMIDARGVINGITIPEDISPGNYLLRGEIIGLHDASKPHGAQPYVHCAELTITGRGTANPPGVAVPGLYNDRDLYIDLYSYYNSFTIPGPEVYRPRALPDPVPASTSTSGQPSVPSSTSSSSSSSAASTTTGSSPTPAPVTSTTTGTSYGSCRVSISQASVSSWNEGGSPATQYNVIMTNVGASAVNLKFRLAAAPSQMWNLVANTDGTYSMPSHITGGLQPGLSFNWGYIVRSIAPIGITLVVPSCEA